MSVLYPSSVSVPTETDAATDQAAVRDRVAAIWQDMLGCGPLSDDTTFFQAGGSSVRLFEAHSRMQQALGVSFDMTLLFETPQLGQLAQELAKRGAADLGANPDTNGGQPTQPASTQPKSTQPESIQPDTPAVRDTDIAIIGLAARIPGAPDLDAFWQAICDGTNLIHRFDPDDLQDALSPTERANPNYVPARSILDDVDQFDAKYFNILPAEAAQMDPQARVFLEICVHALEDAGLDPSRNTPGNVVGVFAGSSYSTYMLQNVLQDRAAAERFTSGFQIDNYNAMTGNISDTLATRVAFKLNLKGPAFSISTACSTSLTAIAQAVTSLRGGLCDVALAGGVSITFPQERGYMTQEGGMGSTDGICRPFDAEANGTVFGHGAGVLVLKPLARALADGDRVEAVIRGVGLNNDGADKIAFTAPSVTGQADAISAAHADADVPARTISYVECHGTATPLGDPIEIRGLSQAFGVQDNGPQGSCALGSVKGNIGHLDAAAGVLSVIKTVRLLQTRTLPPVANFHSLNPRIDLENSPFYVPSGLTDWTSDTPLRAGISGFGIGGTNAHVVLQEAPAPLQPETGQGVQILPLSAKSPEALTGLARDLATDLAHRKETTAQGPDDAQTLAHVAYTLQDGRSEHSYRFAVAADTIADAIDRLRLLPVKSRPATGPSERVFLFPGQGSQYPGMGRDLYAQNATYAHWIDQGLALLAPDLATELRPLLLDPPSPAAAQALKQTRLAQPALFLTQFACAQTWRDQGVHPDRLIGHSIGEFAAAAVAGILTFPDALQLVTARGALMQAQPAGAMLSVRIQADRLMPYLTGDIDLAAENAPKLQVVAGPQQAIDRLAKQLADDGITARALQTSHAFHSAMMQPAAEAFATACAGVRFAPPAIPVLSTLSPDANLNDPAYWPRQMRAPVRFARALQALAENAVLIEVGAGNTLSTFAAQTLARDSYSATIQSMPDHADKRADTTMMAQGLGDLWAAGHPVDWTKTARGNRKLRLPGTCFIRKRHWIDAPAPAVASSASPPDPAHVLPQSAPTSATASASDLPQKSTPMPAPAARPDRPDRSVRLIAELAQLFSDLSGEELTPADADASFLELGFDSLFMGQAAQALSRDYGVTMSFRALLSDYPTLTALAAHLDAVLPAEPEAAPAPELLPEPVSEQTQAPAPEAAPTPAPTPAPAPVMAATGPVDGSMAAVLQAQMQTMQAIFADQLRSMGTQPAQTVTPAAPAVPAATPAAVAVPTPAPTQAAEPAPAVEAAKAEPACDKPAPFKVGRAPSLAQADLTPAQIDFVNDLTARYTARFPSSKSHTQDNRAHHADPRSVAGFRPEWKELTFPIVAAKSKGAYITDLDGNTFVDLVNGFGQTAFGHAPEFVSDAVRDQLDRGYAIGPQADMAGPVARKFARLTGHERVTFCNTGSEAVMAAMRLARTVTGRDTVVVFSNDYHGQFDEVLVKGKSRGTPGALPIAPGIPRQAVSNMIVLPYDAPETLDWIRTNMDQIAAVVVEPVQSRHPELRPADFVRDLRRLTAEGGAALVIDEVVTGFRTHMRGMQGVWDIQPDMATYGKVVGGGMPIGVLAGTSRFMDALDGGNWAYGDDSSPQTAPTFFAGTFVRHPLVVAAIDVVLDHLETQGDRLWVDAANRAQALAGRMNAALTARGLPELVTTYSSWFVINVSRHDPRATLLHALMRLEGVHTLDGFCGFLTTAHTDADCDRIAAAFVQALDALQSVGILAPETQVSRTPAPAPTLTLIQPTHLPTGPIPLTESQREIWMTHQLGDLPAASFNESVSLRFDGPLDQDALHHALDAVIARHDALRTRFARDGAQFEVQQPQSPELTLQDLSGSADPQSAFQDLLRDQAQTPIDLASGLPIRGVLAKMNARDHVLVLTAHHIICDGWSFNTVIQDLCALYNAQINNTEANLAPAPSFATLAAQGMPAMSPETERFWRDVYADVPNLPDLPTDRPRGPRKTFAGATTFASFDATLTQALRKAGARHGCTLFATLFAAVQITLGRLSDNSDIVLGVPTGGQANLPNPDTVGHLVNFLPIRAPFDMSAPAEQHLRTVSETVMQAFEHGDTTLGTLVRSLGIERTLTRLPLTEVQFNLERLPEDIAMGDARASLRANPKAAVNFDLFFNMVETRDGLRAEVDFNTHLFDESTVQRWLTHLNSVLTALASDAATPINALPLMSLSDEQHLATAFNPPRSSFPSDHMLHELVAETVVKTPEAIAITDSQGSVTYAQLWAASGALAAHIQTQTTSGGRIGVAMPRDRSLLVALLGVMRAGMTYIPLDPYQPAARLRNVLEVAEVDAIVAPSATLNDLTAGTEILGIDPNTAATPATPAQTPRDPGAAAYIIFTSGSTGTPKGVAVPHRAVANFLTSMARAPGMTAADKILSVTTVSFDIAVLELFLPLTTGGQVEIASREQVLDAFGLAARLAQPDITMMQATPTLWGMLLEGGFAPRAGLKMLAGGEPLPTDLAQTLASGGTLWNMYGPTETTIWSSISRVEADQPVTIGQPIDNTDLHVLDAQDRLCPPGMIGELNIGGEGLAIGYHGRPDLTEAAFRPVTIAGHSQRLYRTGDLAIRQPDGRLTLLGRRDGQIKLRGYRIELGEIESRLRADPSVAKAAVALKQAASGTDQLVAYLVPADGTQIETGQLSARLLAELPDYMIPSNWVTLADLPQTANGKLDRKALPDPQETAPVRLLRTVEPPVGAQESKLAAIWSEVLGLDEISVTDTIFALGADSLTVFRIAARQIEAGLNLEARHILEHGTIRALAAHAATGAITASKKPSLRDFRRDARPGNRKAGT